MSSQIAVVITLSSSHIHYCKALVASINYFNPEFPVIILKDGEFNTSFLDNQQNVKVVSSKDVNKLHNLDLYILLNKLNILFLPELGFDYDWFIHLDADSVLTNPIDIDIFSDDFDFCILQGSIFNRNDEKHMKSISHYAFNPSDFPEYNFDSDQLFYFSASHIAINKRVIPLLIDGVKKHRYELNKEFLNDKRIKFNDQGFLNLLVNNLSYENQIKVKVKDCGIYGYQDEVDFPLLNLQNIIAKKETKVVFIHYTGSSRKATLKAHKYGEILEYFVKLFHNDNRISFYSSEILRLVEFYKKWFMKRVKYRIKHYKNRIFSN